jgi:hypothetical protein
MKHNICYRDKKNWKFPTKFMSPYFHTWKIQNLHIITNRFNMIHNICDRENKIGISHQAYVT